MGITVLKGDFQGKEVTVVVQHLGSPKVQLVQKASQEKQPLAPTEKETLQTPFLTETAEPKEEKKETFSGAEKPLIAGEEEKISAEEEKKAPTESQKPAFVLRFLSFLNSYYYQISQAIVWASLLFIIAALLISIFIRPDIQHKDLILKTLGVIGVMVLFVFLDREAILNIIPHSLLIQ